jgi:hypothetical protein
MKTRREKGIALIAVVVALMMIGIMSGEFTTNTQVDQLGAIDARDQMQAEFLARSSINLSELILRIQQVLDAFAKNPNNPFGSIQITDYASIFMSAFGGTPEELAGQGLVGDDAKGFGGEVGYFDVRITTDDGKINLNCANGSQPQKDMIYTMIQSLYYFPAFDPVFEDPDSDGWRRDRNLQTQAIIDFIDEDHVTAHGPGESATGGAEDYGYENLHDSYKPKDNYLDTIDEARLIRGVDERFWTLFGPAFTVYGGCKLNTKSLDDPHIIAALLFLTAKDPDTNPVIRDGTLLWYNAMAISWAKKNGYAFGSNQDFIDFAKDPQAQLSSLMGDLGGQTGGQAPPPVQIPGIPQGIQLGIDLDPTKVNQVMAPMPQRTYRVEAVGETSRSALLNPVRRTITAVWDFDTYNNNQRSQDEKARKGAWVYLHEE